MNTIVLATSRHNNPTKGRFAKAPRFHSLSSKNKIKVLEREKDFKACYSSSCRESALNAIATSLMSFRELMPGDFKLWTKVHLGVTQPKLQRQYVKYLYKVLRRTMVFDYTVKYSGVTIVMDSSRFSVPLLSFMLYFPKFSQYFKGLPPRTRMSRKALYNYIPLILAHFNYAGPINAFALWVFLKTNNPGFANVYDHMYGNSSSGVVSALTARLLKGGLMNEWEQYQAVYHPVISNYSDKLAYAIEVHKLLPYNQFRSNRLYGRNG